MRFWPALLLLGACSSPTRVCLTRPQCESLNLHFDAGVAADREGAFYVGGENVVRYEAGRHSVERLLLENSSIVDVAMAEGGVLALRRTSLDAVFAGKLMTIVALPGNGIAISTFEGSVWILMEMSGERELVRYSLEAKTMETVFRTPDPVQAICAVRGGCLIASNDSVYKVFDPEVLLLCSVAGITIRSLAADADSLAVYFSDEDATYAWIEGRIVFLYPMGGRLAFTTGSLWIASCALRQLVHLRDPGGRASALVD